MLTWPRALARNYTWNLKRKDLWEELDLEEVSSFVAAGGSCERQ